MTIQTILVPTDFSELSNDAVDFAFSMAKQMKAKVIFLHTIVWPGHLEEMTRDGSWPSNISPRTIEGPKYLLEEETPLYEKGYAFMKDRASSLLNDMVQKAKNQGLEASGELVDGVPFVEIIQMAREKKADLIVMGTHGRTGLSHIMIGSQAERVVVQSPCPVLTVKSAKHKFTPV